MPGRRRVASLAFRPWRRPNSAHRSLWLEQALAGTIEPHPLEGQHRVDICIIGGGYTGLWTANRLIELDPSLRVAVVEADRCGAGASGRNSGAMSHWWSKLPMLLALFGPETAVRVLQASIAVLDDVQSFLVEHAIDCELRHAPSVWSATATAQIGAWDKMFRAADTIGLAPPYRQLSTAELRRMFGRGPQLAGIVEDDAIRVHPALLACGLQRTALTRGVQLFEHSPVRHVRGDATALTVSTERGTIVADKVLLAANAWMAHLPEFRPSIVVVSSDIVVTDPIPDLLDRHGIRERPAAINSRLMMNYGGLTPDGRVYLGRGGGTLAYAARVGPAFDWSAKQAAEVADDFRFLYPELRDVPVARGWAGPVDRSRTGLPWFGQLADDDRVHYAIGYSGHGVAASALAGRILASTLMGRADAWGSLGACFQRARTGWYPPEPIRYLAGRAVRAAVARKETAEREGRQPSRLSSALASLAPATITDVRQRAA